MCVFPSYLRSFPESAGLTQDNRAFFSDETWWLPERERWIRMGAREAAKTPDDLQTTT
jgi:hypothetical protein